MPGGRPTVFDEITIQKLEQAYSNDATDEQACFLANISQSSLYNYQKEHPEFLERKKALKAMTTYQAKINIKEKVMDGDIDTSKWLTERKEKSEGYSTRTELTGADGETLNTVVSFNYVKPDNADTETDNQTGSSMAETTGQDD